MSTDKTERAAFELTSYETTINKARACGARVVQHEIGFTHDEFERFLATHEHDVVSAFLERTGQYLTNDASREAAIAEAIKAALPSQPATVVQPVAEYADSTPNLHIGDSAFEDWYQNYLPNSVGHKQIARDAYAAGMGDPLVVTRNAVHPSAPAESGWQPIASAPDGVRVLLGPREAPVVGIVRQMPEWADEQEPVASVIHYNGTVLVAGYHCSEWHPLPAAPSAAQPGGADGGNA